MIELYNMTDNRRFACPVTPWRRGIEDATYEATYANPYRLGTQASADYDNAFRRATADRRSLGLGATVRGGNQSITGGRP